MRSSNDCDRPGAIAPTPVETIAGLIVAPSAPSGRVWTIGELARACEVTQRALRFYEGKRLLAPARDSAGRFYDDDDLRRLKLVLRYKDIGFSLVEIHELLALGERGGGAALAQVLARVEAQTAALDERRRDIERSMAIAEREIAALRRGIGG